jgi:hypothetical protein
MIFIYTQLYFRFVLSCLLSALNKYFPHEFCVQNFPITAVLKQWLNEPHIYIDRTILILHCYLFPYYYYFHYYYFYYFYCVRYFSEIYTLSRVLWEFFSHGLKVSFQDLMDIFLL